MGDIGEQIRAQLWELQDEAYRDFHARLIPTVALEKIIGVRTPQVRRLAKKWAKDPQIGEFLERLPHAYYDENNVHAFIVEQFKDYGECLEQTERFLPFIDNWATCDMMAPKVFASHTAELLKPVRRWIGSRETYTVRFGVGMLMRFYLDGAFRPEYPEWVAGIRSEEYYINMMRAWYFATALAKQYDAVVPFLESRRLDEWTHRKAIQKACESRRMTAEQKLYLRGLKV
ncbi:MAG: DNA alkylation repair protein [Lachnospiraceae bacterium]|nr:DNA alkylation repair protein [Lachnospiraceae bacterium]